MVIYSIRYHPFCNLLLMGNYAASGSSPLWEIGECENWWKLLMNLFSLSLAIFFNYRDAIKSTSPFTALDCARNCGGDSGSLVMFLIDPVGWLKTETARDRLKLYEVQPSKGGYVEGKLRLPRTSQFIRFELNFMRRVLIISRIFSNTFLFRDLHSLPAQKVNIKSPRTALRMPRNIHRDFDLIFEHFLTQSFRFNARGGQTNDAHFSACIAFVCPLFSNFLEIPAESNLHSRRESYRENNRNRGVDITICFCYDNLIKFRKLN